jgi:hypothetical protein
MFLRHQTAGLGPLHTHIYINNLIAVHRSNHCTIFKTHLSIYWVKNCKTPSIWLWSKQTEILVDSAGVSVCLVCLQVIKWLREVVRVSEVVTLGQWWWLVPSKHCDFPLAKLQMQLQENWFLGKEGCPDDDDVKLGNAAPRWISSCLLCSLFPLWLQTSTWALAPVFSFCQEGADSLQDSA